MGILYDICWFTRWRHSSRLGGVCAIWAQIFLLLLLCSHIVETCYAIDVSWCR